MNPLVSIIIPTYNHARFVASAVDSALAQTFLNREVLVVDDGSTDNTRETLAPYGVRIRYIHQENKGLSAARNTGIRAAQGEFIALLDADDMWLPEKLEVQMAVFREHPDAGVVSCVSEVVDEGGEGQRAEGRGQRGKGRGQRAEGGCRFEDLLQRNCFSGGSNAVVRRACFDVVGLFDESLRSAEDWDMWLRISRRYPLRVTRQVLTRIRVSADSMSAPKNAERMLVNERRVLGKLFADPTSKVKAYDRGMAYAHRYVAAAWAHHKVGNRKEASAYIRKAFLANPLHFLLRRSFCGLAIRIVLGRERGESGEQGEEDCRR